MIRVGNLPSHVVVISLRPWDWDNEFVQTSVYYFLQFVDNTCAVNSQKLETWPDHIKIFFDSATLQKDEVLLFLGFFFITDQTRAITTLQNLKILSASLFGCFISAGNTRVWPTTKLCLQVYVHMNATHGTHNVTIVFERKGGQNSFQ